MIEGAMNFIIVLFIFLIAACSRHTPKADHSSIAEQLAPVYQDRLKAYASEVPSANDGWPSLLDCDGTVWAGTACLGGAVVSITDAEYPNAGELQRRPKSIGSCYPGSSDSSASRDDAVLYMSCSFSHHDVNALERFQSYLQANGGYIGQPSDPNLTLMTPTLNALLARAISKLGGTGGNPGAVIEAPGAKDYQDHIELEEISFSTAVNGGANDWEIGLLDSLEAQYPNDALFQAAKGVYTGDCTAAPQMLLDPGIVIPTYVRGSDPKTFADAWWLRAAAIVLSHCT